MASTLRLFSFLLILILLIPACKRKPEDLEVWRTSKGGMEKLSEWAASAEEPLDVRVRATQILLEDRQEQRLPLILDRIESPEVRATIVSGLVTTVDSMWATQDMPRLTDEIKEGGGEIAVGDSKAVRAKDAAYILVPYANPEEKTKLQKILADWLSTDHELRDQLGNANLAQILPRAGKEGLAHTATWLKETKTPGTVARAIREHADDDLKAELAKIILARAEEAHPDIDRELEIAILETEHDAIIPYLQRAIADPQTDHGLIDGAMNTMIKIQGERAAAYLGRIISEQHGLLRWVAANKIIDLRGEAGFISIANALPLEPDTYPVPAADSFKKDAEQLCNLFSTEMAKLGTQDVSQTLLRALQGNRWPAQALALQCTQTTRSAAIADAVNELRASRQPLPGWGETSTIGQLAQNVHAAITQ